MNHRKKDKNEHRYSNTHIEIRCVRLRLKIRGKTMSMKRLIGKDVEVKWLDKSHTTVTGSVISIKKGFVELQTDGLMSWHNLVTIKSLTEKPGQDKSKSKPEKTASKKTSKSAKPASDTAKKAGN
jgi:hypothetical protein